MKVLSFSFPLFIILIIILNFSINNGLEANDLFTLSFSKNESIQQEGDFTGSFTMSITEIKKGKPTKNSPVKIDYYFKDDQVAFVPEAHKGQKTMMIYDFKDRMVTTLMDKDGEKTGMKIKMPKIKINDKFDDQEYTIKATDEKKTIEGFACRKYLIESEENAGYAWITEDAKIDYEKIANYLNLDQKKLKISGPTLQDLKGFAMEIYTKSKKKEEAYEMKVTNLSIGKLSNDVFDISEYAVTDMSSLMNFGGE